MASRTASVKLTLEGSSYLSGIRQIGNTTEAVAKRSGKAWDMARAGLEGMKSSASSMLGSLKGLLGTAATLGGALSVGKLAHDAIKMQSTYRDLAFSLSRAKNEAVGWQDVQKQIERAAAKTTRTSEEMAEAFGGIFADVGDAEFAGKALETVGTLATASGRPVKELASIAGGLNEKFGVTAEQLPDALAAMLEFANRGGVGMEDLDRIIAITGASARAAGLSGEEGFRQMIALANVGDDALGTMKKSLTAITGLLDSMVSPETAKQLKLTFGVSTKDAKGEARNMMAVLEDVMKKTHGQREKLAKVFTGEQLKLVTELGKPFAEAFDQAQGNVKEKTEAGVKAFRENLQKAGATSFNFAKAQEEAAKRADDPQTKYRQAMQKLSEATQKPEMINAINELAANLPKLAEALASVVSWASKSPLAAGGALVGGKLAFAGLEAALVSAFQKGGTAGAGSFGGALSAGGPWIAIAGAIGAGLVAYMVEKGMREFNEKSEADRTEIQKRGKDVRESILAAQSKINTGQLMSPDEMRLARGELTAQEQRDIDEAEAERSGGLPAVDRLRKRQAGTGSVGMGALARAGETLEAQQAIGAAGLLSGPSNMTTSPEVARLLEQQGKTDVKLSPDAGAEVGRQVANGIAGKTLKVEVVNQPGTSGFGGGSGKRGTIIPSLITTGGGF